MHSVALQGKRASPTKQETRRKLLPGAGWPGPCCSYYRSHQQISGKKVDALAFSPRQFHQDTCARGPLYQASNLVYRVV